MTASNVSPLRRLAVVAPAAVVTMIGLHLVADLVVCTLVGAMLAIAVEPLGRSLKRRGVPAYAAASITIATVLLFAAGIILLLARALQTLSTNVGQYQEAAAAFRLRGIRWLKDQDLGAIVPMIREFDLAEQMQSALLDGLTGTASLLGSFLFVLLVTVFILLEAATFKGKLKRMTNGDKIARLTAGQAVRRVQRYLIFKTAMSALTGILVGLVTFAFGLSSPILWGLLAFALNYIPFVGSLLAAVPALVLATVELGVASSFTLGAIYLAINVIVGNIMEPRILGQMLGLSPLAVLLAVVLWGVVLGPVGALLSVPITMVAMICFAHTEKYQWVAILLARGRTAREVAEGKEPVSVIATAS